MREPGGEPQLRIAVGGGGVDVVDAELDGRLEGALCVRLRDVRERRGTEDRA